MRKVRNMGAALALAATFMANAAAAAPRGDRPYDDLGTRIKRVIVGIVTILEDIRISIPP
ncbi:MAG: hypothetical protein AABO58_06220 [Acidobacteriota bacterium]